MNFSLNFWCLPILVSSFAPSNEEQKTASDYDGRNEGFSIINGSTFFCISFSCLSEWNVNGISWARHEILNPTAVSLCFLESSGREPFSDSSFCIIPNRRMAVQWIENTNQTRISQQWRISYRFLFFPISISIRIGCCITGLVFH